MESQHADIRVSGSIIAEFPSEEDAGTFKFGKEIPILPLRDNIAFPGLPVPVPMSNEADLNIAEQIYNSRDCVFAVATKSKEGKPEKLKDFHSYGTVCKIGKIIKMPDMDPVVFLLPGPRARLKKILKKDPLTAEISVSAVLTPDESYETKCLVSNIKEMYDKLLAYLPDNEKQRFTVEMDDFTEQLFPGLYYMVSNSPLTHDEKAALLGAKNFTQFLEEFISYLDLGLQKIEIQANIQRRTHQELNNQQRNHFLQQQLQNIKAELGDNDDSDLKDLQDRASKISWSKEAKAHFEKELKKLERFNTANPEYSIQYSYLDTLLSLPWDKYSNDNFTLSKVEKILNRDHFGLDEVKERIIEHMAVLKLRNDMKAPIICLYGPPGVGKTSLGKSIADALGRKYARVSLGGLHDEAEIRGHRRTYIGAMPGRIISALQKCGSGNPVFVLDEIDKIGKDFKGDPSTALLEVLDPEQNSRFHDNYLDFDYDLSKILFIATANSLSEISGPLRDRMEIIEIGGYIPEEKVEIALRHLVPKALEEHGFSKDELSFSRPALHYIVDHYTRESGVRQLEKKIAKVIRKLARIKASNGEMPKLINLKEVKSFLGKEEVNPEMYDNNRFAGVVTGLAWTQVGGEILYIETSLSPGNGEKLTLTGNLGDVMKESAAIALQYLKAHAEKLGIPSEMLSKRDIHIHVPEGAIPKDGPSAGITMATSIASAMTGRKVRDKVAMTGEITLRGKVLPVGGIKEKILAAKRAGITDIVLSKENEKDIDEIKKKYLNGLTFHYVETVEDVLSFALLPELAEDRFN